MIIESHHFAHLFKNPDNSSEETISDYVIGFQLPINVQAKILQNLSNPVVPYCEDTKGVIDALMLVRKEIEGSNTLTIVNVPMLDPMCLASGGEHCKAAAMIQAYFHSIGQLWGDSIYTMNLLLLAKFSSLYYENSSSDIDFSLKELLELSRDLEISYEEQAIEGYHLNLPLVEINVSKISKSRLRFIIRCMFDFRYVFSIISPDYIGYDRYQRLKEDPYAVISSNSLIKFLAENGMDENRLIDSLNSNDPSYLYNNGSLAFEALARDLS